MTEKIGNWKKLSFPLTFSLRELDFKLVTESASIYKKTLCNSFRTLYIMKLLQLYLITAIVIIFYYSHSFDSNFLHD